MGKLQMFDIVLDNPAQQAVYYPGQVVSGQVIAEFNEEMKMRGIRVLFHGGANVHWTERHSTGSGKNRRTVTRHYRNSQTYFHLTATLCGKAEGQSGDNMMHPVGRHIYPFRFTLPQNLPSSFEAVTGQVRYWLKGTIDKPWKFDHHCKRAFTVLSVLDLNLINDARSPQQNQGSKTLCCLCCKSGPIAANVHLDRKGYVSGEFITISGEVTNHSNRRMDGSYVELRMTTSFHATNKTRTLNKVVSKIQKGPIEPGESETWNREALYIPPLPPSLLPNCDIIHIFYTVVTTSFHATNKTRTLNKVVSKIQKGPIEPGESETWNREALYIPPLPPSLLPNCDIIHIFYTVVMVVDPSGPSFDLNVPIQITLGTIPLQNMQSMFATGVCSYEVPSYDEAMGGQAPPPVFPGAPTPGALQPTAPPPSYAESVLGKVDLHDEEDNEHTRGEMSWAPVYSYYSWGNQPNQQV